MMHYVAMRFPRIAVVALGLCIAMSSASSSFADATPTPSPSPSQDYQTLLAQYKVAMTAFDNAIKSRERDRTKINQIFANAVNDANRNAKTALKSAKNPTAKSDVLAAQRAAIALANSMRDAAILAMGPPPIEPVEPIEPVDLTKTSKTTKASPSKKSKSAKASPSPTS